ncbi:phosphoadenylyl-sulfate reductase [Tianweitania sediminis]|uniref:Adenosine 5'-phosphosulfate reductase n=1 Tax=Tianweitania sediminis TaxID=1502156 RepID=A0A8J7RAJ7_9HYPH|nr:phosphoadenylyl-sulfate reductase [Tianweitania sediminis]MBP0441447.1 phosphoadenylyl-sulfate reductase [Tianweitania sediminis]
MNTATVDDSNFATFLQPLDLEGRVLAVSRLPGRKLFTTSLGIEDQVITAAIARSGAAIELATLETGRLFPETLELIDVTQTRYGLTIERFRPQDSEAIQYAAAYGVNGFYDSVEARHACCQFRKLAPLSRALQGVSVWITGVRRGQSGARADAQLCEFDEARGILKINPLADADLEIVQRYATQHEVPLNPLHARGYPSIGCEPCTRAIKPGEPERAGRWWWEQDLTRECGLHVKPGTSRVVQHPSSQALSS